MIYTNYTNRIKDIVAKNHERNLTEKGWDNFTGPATISGVHTDRKKMIQEQRNFSNKMQLNAQPLGSILHPAQLNDAKLGMHPDFKHLKGTDNIEYHYITSIFMDIQGSTNLHNQYDLEEIYIITNTVQSAAIHTMIALGGHVQRLQGDGVFAYFGGKNIDKTRSVELAVIACSMFTYFIENDLKNVFLQDGMEDIKTRIGIDFGDDKDVLWANFGLMDVSELTTLSLHTSLASKMQQWASKNGIVVGQHIKDRLKTEEGICDLVRNSKGEVEKRYIFENPKKNFRYTQYAFNWYKFLKALPFVKSDADGKLYIVDQHQDEMARLQRLRNTSAILSSANAYVDQYGKIGDNPSGVHHQPHRFHYGK
jgi:adenylate cyclase